MRLLVTVTLNTNQLRAHLEPIIALPEVEEIILVADRAEATMPKLRTVVPPRALRLALGRAGAKLLACLMLAVRLRPEWVVAYNLVPHGLSALLVGLISRRPTLVHLIGGEREWEGGGWKSDNAIVGRLRRPHRILEQVFVSAIRRASFVSVMGARARDNLVGRGVAPTRVRAIPASVDTARFSPQRAGEPHYDLVSVAQLIPRKRIEDLLHVTVKLRQRHPALRVAIVGSGPLEGELRRKAEELGVCDIVDFLGFRRDIDELYASSRVFVLTSRSEGLSIAITEAMSTGLPVVVTDVGEIRDLVRPGENGFLFAVGDVETLYRQVDIVLTDDALRARMARAAAEDARALCSVDRIASIYREVLARAE